MNPSKVELLTTNLVVAADQKWSCHWFAPAMLPPLTFTSDVARMRTGPAKVIVEPPDIVNL
ncbi:MAG TPA: hypothetical protein VGJ81_13755 [Thermoanaerobaculia bacterium]